MAGIPIFVERVTGSRLPPPDLSATPFGEVMSDHMLVAAFEGNAWRRAKVQPCGPLELLPNISALQYGLSVFEGLKAHRAPTGEVLLFRPSDNARRMIRSAERLAMPPVPEELFLTGLERLLQVDQAWVPETGRGALYIRPLSFSNDPSVRVKPAERLLFVIFTFPFSAYFSGSVDAWASDRHARAFPGGTGDVKPAGNYAPALLADREAAANGCQTVLWLDALQREYVEECGVMNVFFVLRNTIVTPNLSGTILPGVTRDSVLTLLRDRGVAVEERQISIGELIAAHERGDLLECFGTGTAATVTHIGRIRYREHELILPLPGGDAIGSSIRAELVAIATGRAPDTHGWVRPVPGTPAAGRTTGERNGAP